MQRLCNLFTPKRPSCSACYDLKLYPSKVNKYGAFSHSTEFSTISKSADDGCPSCAFLRDGVSDILESTDLGQIVISTVREPSELELDGVGWNPFRARTCIRAFKGGLSTKLEFYSDDGNAQILSYLAKW